MLAILNITLPIFLLIGIGYLSSRLNFITLAQMEVLGVYVVKIAFPALVVVALSSNQFSEVFIPSYFFTYASAAALMFIGGFIIVTVFKKKDRTKGALLAVGVSTSNTGYIGYAVLSLVLGKEKAAIFLSMNLVVENFITLLPMIMIAESAKGENAHFKDTVKVALTRLIKNPIIIGLWIGVLMSIFEIQLPTALYKTLDMIALSAAPIAIYVIGGNLAGVKLKNSIKIAVPITCAKLIIHPLLVLSLFLIQKDINTTQMMAGILLSAAPMITLFAIFGQQYGENELTSGTLVFTTLMSFFSLSFVLACWQYFFAVSY